MTQESTFTVVAYYAKNGDVRQVGRFKDPAKAKKAILASQLAGQHAEVIASDLPLKETRILMANYKDDNGIAPGVEAIPNKPKQVSPRRSEPKIRTRIETNEFGTYEIRSTKVKCIAVC